MLPFKSSRTCFIEMLIHFCHKRDICCCHIHGIGSKTRDWHWNTYHLMVITILFIYFSNINRSISIKKQRRPTKAAADLRSTTIAAWWDIILFLVLDLKARIVLLNFRPNLTWHCAGKTHTERSFIFEFFHPADFKPVALNDRLNTCCSLMLIPMFCFMYKHTKKLST